MKKNKYEFFSLNPSERKRRKKEIVEFGVINRPVVDQFGELIFGFEDKQICDELKIPCPVEVQDFASEQERYEFGLRKLCAQPNYDKKELLTAYLVCDPQIANNTLAEIVRVSKNTVEGIRSELESTCQIDKFEYLRGKDGKLRPRRYKTIVTNNDRERDDAIKIINDLPKKCMGKIFDPTTAMRWAQRERSKQQREAKSKSRQPVECESTHLYHCPFQKLQGISGILDGSANLVLVDFPYDGKFMEQLEDSAKLTEKLLAPGGIAVFYLGSHRLTDKLAIFDRYLTYRTKGTSAWEGRGNPMRHQRYINKHVDWFVFSNGEWIADTFFCDTFINSPPAKKWHKWGRPMNEVISFVDWFSQPGHTVVDFCLGGGSTAESCLRLGGRNFYGCDIDQECVEVSRNRIAKCQGNMTQTLIANLEDAQELGCNIPKQVIRDTWTSKTECAEFAFAPTLLGLNSPIASVYEALP